MFMVCRKLCMYTLCHMHLKYTIVWKKFNVENFHAKNVRVKIFSSSQVADEIFLTANNYIAKIFPTCFACVIATYVRAIYTCYTWRRLPAVKTNPIQLIISCLP